MRQQWGLRQALMTEYRGACRAIHIYRSLPEQIQNLHRTFDIKFHQLVQKLSQAKTNRIYISSISNSDGHEQNNNIHRQLQLYRTGRMAGIVHSTIVCRQDPGIFFKSSRRDLGHTKAPAPNSTDNRALSSGSSGRGTKLTIRLHAVPRLRMNGAIRF